MQQEKTYEPLVHIEEVVAILNHITILGGLTERQLYTVFQLLQRVSYTANEIVFRQDEAASYIYIIRSGAVKIVVNMEEEPLELITFRTGQCFGETSVIGIQSHSASALAVEDTELIVLSREALLSIFDSDKELFGMLIMNIAREACRRLHKTDEVLLHYVRTHNGNHMQESFDRSERGF